MGLICDILTPVVIASLVIYHCTPVSAQVSYPPDYEVSLSEPEKTAVDAQYSMMDSILEDLVDKYDKMKTDSFWHPYDFGSGNENREVIRVLSLTQYHIPGEFKQWKTIKLGLQQNLVGLGASSVKIFNSKLNEVASKDFPSSLKTMDISTKWDRVRLQPFMILLVATNEPSIVVLTMRDKRLEQIGSLPLQFPVKSVMVCQVDNSDKVVLTPEDSTFPINIYNLEVTEEGAQLWFFQRITEPGIKNAIAHQPDTPDSMLILAGPSHLSVYHFISEPGQVGQFSIQQTLHLTSESGTGATCTDIFYFTLMYQHYIGCLTTSVNQTENDVQFFTYNYNMNEYEDKRRLKTVDSVSEIYPVRIEGSRDDLVFIARNKEAGKDAVDVLTFDGKNHFQVGHECSLDACKKLTRFSQGAHFIFEDTDAFIFPSDREGSPIISIVTEVLTRSSPVFDHSLGLYGEFKRLSEGVDLWRHIVSEAENTLANKVNTQTDNTITGNWTVSSIATKDVTVNPQARDHISDKLFNVLRFGDVNWTEEDFASTTEDILEKMTETEKSADFIMNKLNDAVLNNFEEKQIVSSPIIMVGGVTADDVLVDNLVVSKIGGEDVLDFFNSLANKQAASTNVNGGLVFTQPLKMNKLQTNKINEVEVDNFATLTGDNVYSCQTRFESFEALQDIQVEMVNGKNLAESVVMANEVRGFKFTDGIVAVDGAWTEEEFPFDDVLLRSLEQIVMSPVELDMANIIAPLMVNSINGVNFDEFVGKIVSRAHRGKVMGKKTFTGRADLNALNIAGTWNGLRFPTDFYSVTDSEIILDGRKSFDRMNAENVIVEETVDGVSTSDLISLSQPDKLNSAWTFNGDVKILDDIFVDNHVDGVRMESFMHNGVLNTIEGIFRPEADIIFEGPVSIENLEVDETLNEKDFNEMFDKLILFDDRANCFVPGKTTILHDTVFADVELKDNKINDFPIDNFLTRNTQQVINNEVHFSGPTSFDEIYALDRIDSVLVKNVLETALRVSHSTTDSTITTIPWALMFEWIECKDNLRVEGPINGVDGYGLNVARTRGLPTQSFTGQIIMENPTFTEISTEQLQLDEGRTVQTMDVNKWSSTRAKLSEPATFSQPFTVNSVSVEGDLSTNSVNGILVSDLNENVFRKDKKSQTFSGPIVIRQGMNVFNGDIHFLDTVDGFVLDDVIQHGFPLNGRTDEAIRLKNEWEFKSLIFDKDFKVTGTVCGVDLHQLDSDSVKRTDDNVQIFGEKTFNQRLTISESLTTPQINDKSLDNLFLLHTDQDIQTRGVFNGDVSKNVLEANSINNLDMSWLSQMYSFEDGQHIVNHDVVVNDLIKADSLRVDGTVQDINFDDFLKGIWSLSDANIQFEDDIVLRQPVVIRGDVEAEQYNGIEINKLYDQVVSVHDNIIIQRPVSFTGNVEAVDGVLANGNLEAENIVGVNWNELMTKSININDEQQLPGNVEFKHVIATGPVTVEKLNGIPFENYATLNTKQDLGNLRILKGYLNNSNVEVKGTVGGYKISDEFQDTLMSDTGKLQKISGSVVFTGPVHITHDISCGGEDLKNKLSTSENLVIQGPVEFLAPIVAKQDVEVTNPINGQTAESIFNNALSTDRQEQRISDLWEFRGPVTFKQNLVGEGLRDKLDIKSLIDEKEEELKKAEKRVAQEKQLFTSKCERLKDIEKDVRKYPVKLDMFEGHQAIGLKQEATNILAVDHETDPFIMVQSTNCQLYLYKWMTYSKSFEELNVQYQIGQVEFWQAVPYNAAYSVIAFSQTPSDCSHQTGLYYFTISSSGEMSQIKLISGEPVKSFKLIRKEDVVPNKILLFALFANTDEQISVYHFGTNYEFEQTGELQFNTKVEKIEATVTYDGFGIMYKNQVGVHAYDYMTGPNNRLLLDGTHPIFSSGGSMVLFEDFGLKYALIPELTHPGISLVQPTCNFQVIRFHNGSVETIQKLEVPEVASLVHFQFSKNHFLALLSKSNGLFLYKFKGLGGFQLESAAPNKVFGGFFKLQQLQVKEVDFEYPRPYLIALAKNTIEIYRGRVIGDRLMALAFPIKCDV